MQRDIKILMHTHWDREWYFTKDETKVLLRNHMQEVMDFLEENDDVSYILDGQSVMIDDYLELEPEAEPRLRKLIANKQLHVGPWYTQTDLLLVHGESIYRNLYYGIKRAKEFGEPMLIGYAPDTFGHASQMPQIYDQFDINATVFWRGFSELKAEKSDFVWKGIDGTEITGVNLATGYQGAKYLENDMPGLETRMKKIMDVLDNYSSGDQRLIMNGHDQMPIQKDIKEVMEKIRILYPEDKVAISDFESYVAGLEMEQLERVEGELTHSKHARIHRTIGSTRMDIKLLNSEIEYKLFNVLEPMAVIGERAGIAYPHGVIESILKYLFGTHAHDSIGGCNSDKVNQDIKQRLLIAKEMIDTQIELHLRLLTLARTGSDKTIVLLNLLPEERQGEYVEYEMLTRTKHFNVYDEEGNDMPYTVLSQQAEDAGLIDRQVAARLQDITVYRTTILVEVAAIAGLSVRYFSYAESEDAADGSDPVTPEASETPADTIENQWGRLSVQGNQFIFENKLTGAVYPNILTIENSGDAGDSYDYSPPVNDWVLNSGAIGEISCNVRKSTDMQEMLFTLTMSVPANEKEREAKLANAEIAYSGTLRLYKNDPKVFAALAHTNTVEDSRYRIVLKTGIVSDEVTVDGYLCSQVKPVYLEKELSVWEEENWAEKPVSVETAQSYMTLQDETRKASLYTYGLKEYEVLEDEIHLTLFRSFSHLGKRNLVNRPGRPSGIEIPTPDNQLSGKTFRFQFAFGFSGRERNAAREARKFLTPLVAYQRKEFNRFNLNRRDELLETTASLSLDLGEAVVSALKLTENGEVFLRLFNPSDAVITVDLPEGSFLSDGMETKSESISAISLAPQQIGNVILNK
jgi:mannosylglycerate hydrolase